MQRLETCSGNEISFFEAFKIMLTKRKIIINKALSPGFHSSYSLQKAFLLGIKETLLWVVLADRVILGQRLT